MSDVVISVENLTKEYRIGTISHRTLQRDLQTWWARLRGKDDPNLPVEGGRRKKLEALADENGIIHALKNVSFEVKQGEVLGIIGKNGAGKSTLLKILSRVTAPTSGCVKIKGRIGSLLEVGTGFHPELTGRENIYMNGAILGMKKREIDRKLDEIIDFSGVEQFIDTPVKRYSSGMYVRLAFAVAAHLDPEILVIDEVLAVGDAEFQKKCLGKMDDVSKKEGRTVLFVSHNMAAIRSLCGRSLLLEAGINKLQGRTDDIIDQYLNKGGIVEDKMLCRKISKKSPLGTIQITRILIVEQNGTISGPDIDGDRLYYAIIEGDVLREDRNSVIFMSIYDQYDNCLLLTDIFENTGIVPSDLRKGPFRLKVSLPLTALNSADYRVAVSCVIHYKGWEVLPNEEGLNFRLHAKIFDHPVYGTANHPVSGKNKPSMLAIPATWELFDLVNEAHEKIEKS